ncbi:GRAM domain-containing protein [Hirsutella rhossiliensis]|uniref:Sterol 3-beta-glucosyltransferase n=1 Tax=Hirsutella rhossiliensis TaxID=111463 RepID=A0A9P8MS69_9HYPO|nr:GRAM domain-containing protein [Hirsutella rhossiliensis]KAH0960174.1 GRAM domain-containing protein [Hirsutella rhossiliensis]
MASPPPPPGGDDAQRDSDSEDEPPSHVGPTRPGPLSVNMNQSIFSLIAAAGSRVNFNERFDDGSSDDDASQPQDLSKTVVLDPSPGRDAAACRHKKKLSGHRLLKSLSTLPRRKTKTKRESSHSSAPVPSPDSPDDSDDASQPSAVTLQKGDSRVAPVMSRMLQARAEMSSRPSFDLERPSADVSRTEQGDDATTLAKRLKDIFDFDEPEQVIEEYPCWLLQSVLLQGFLYITVKHICFYAYLPKKANVVAKSGYLSKNGKRNPKYNRYWFRLKGDVLSYYRDPRNLYFPHGQIDLRFGISASVVDRDKDGVHFSVVTSHRTYNFRADSTPSAKEWVKSLQRVIFRSHNDGDSVKISLPIENVIDVEETQMMDFSDTCKIRVIDNDETYAIDEYFFSFFTFGREAINVLKILVEDASSSGKQTAGRAIAEKQNLGNPEPPQSTGIAGSARPSNFNVDNFCTTKLPEAVKATLSPMSPHSTNPSPRASHEVSSRTSLDAFRQMGGSSREASSVLRDMSPRRSFSSSRRSLSRRPLDGKSSRNVMESSDSNLQSSTDDPSYSNLTVSVTDDPSASQILRGSEVFQSPTMRRSPSSSQSTDTKHRGSRDSQQQPLASPRPVHAATTGAIGQQPAQASIDHQRPSTPTLQSITKMGSYPLQRAGAFADYLNKTSKRMSSLLATESMGYVEKVSGMWKGGHKHYDEPAGLRPDEDELEEDSEGKIQTSMDRFRAHFALPETERLQATYFGYILRVLPLYGKIYISDRSFCFRSLLPGTRTKLILPLKDVETTHKEKGFRFGYSGLVVVIRGHEEIFFEFSQTDVRDDCAVTLLQGLETSRYLRESGILREEEHEEDVSAIAERDALKSARQSEFPEHDVQLPREATGLPNAPTILSDDTDGSFINFKPQNSMKITCLTIGSRGDVQPYIALCKGLLAEGHRPRIATHAEFQGWIESHGIEFARVEGDPGELMRLCIENGTFTLAFLREANSTFRGWLDELLDSAYHACEGSDLLIESPSAMAGIHIAEKLGIPYFRAFTMPWTRTRAYPHAFIMPEHKMGGAYNYMTYVMFDNIFWRATAHQVNRWRNKTLGLPNTGLEKMQPNKVPFLYNFSPSVVAPPLDFSDWIRVTGYWFLDEGGEYEPPKELDDFIKKARADGKKLVYVGFGSIIVNNPAKMTQEVIDAVRKADVRCILSKGWSDRISPKDDPSKPRPDEPEMPPEIHVIKSAPHDWLFRQIDAAAHHGGSGTTGASLRAGVPTVIRPFFGDQYFFASRVEDLGVGVWVKRWGTNSFGRALWEVTRNERMIIKARVLGEQIRKEKGVEHAIQSIYRDLEYATSLVKCKAGKNAQLENEEEDDETEESWTFVGVDEPDPDMVTKKLSEGLGGVGMSSGKSLGSQALKGNA